MDQRISVSSPALAKRKRPATRHSSSSAKSPSPVSLPTTRVSGGIAKRRRGNPPPLSSANAAGASRGFARRDQVLPESPPPRTSPRGSGPGAAIMAAVRARYREAMDLLFRRPLRVLNAECTARLSAPVPTSPLDSSRSAGVSAPGNSASDQVVPSGAQIGATGESSLATLASTACDGSTTCQCGQDVWTSGGVPPEQMLRAGEELSEKIMTLYATALDENGGSVDYSRLLHSQDFKEYVAAARKLRYFDPLLLSHAERKAFFLNVYNCLMIHAIAVLSRPRTMFERIQLYNCAAYSIGGRHYSLDMMEHGVLRGNRPGGGPFAQAPFGETDARVLCSLPEVDPRIHFALNCGARSCPAVRFYEAKSIDSSLDSACRNFLQDVKVDTDRRAVVLSRIFQWYRTDFSEKGDDEALLNWILPYLTEDKQQALRGIMISGRGGPYVPRIEFASYDWSVNDSSV